MSNFAVTSWGGIILKLLKVGEFLDGSSVTVKVVVFGQLLGQNFQAHSRLLLVKSTDPRCARAASILKT